MILNDRSEIQEWRKRVGTIIRGKYTTITNLIYLKDPADNAERDARANALTMHSNLMAQEMEPRPVKPMIDPTDANYGNVMNNHATMLKVYDSDKQLYESRKSQGYTAINEILTYISALVKNEITVMEGYETALMNGDAPWVWNEITSRFKPVGNDSHFTYIAMITSLFNMKQEDNENIIQYANRYIQKRNVIRETYQFNLPDQQKESILFLHGLNQHYEQLVTNFKVNNTKIENLNSTINSAINYPVSHNINASFAKDKHNKKLTDKGDYQLSTNDKKTRENKIAENNKPISRYCSRCNKSNHTTKQCRYRFKANNSAANAEILNGNQDDLESDESGYDNDC